MTDRPTRSARARELLRRKSIRLALAAAVVAALVLLAPGARRAAREWSRGELGRQAESTLEDALGATVEIEEARMPTLRRLELSGVRITDVRAHPEVASLLVAEAVAVPGGGETVAGSWTSIERLDLHGVVLTLRPRPAGEPQGEAEPAPPLRIGRLELHDAIIVTEGALDVGAIRVEGAVDDWGGHPRGEARVRAHRVPARALLQAALGAGVAPWIASLKGCCGELQGVVRLEPDGRLAADGTLRIPAGVPGDGEPERVLVVTGTGAPADASGRRHVVIDASAEGLLTLAAEAEHGGAGLASVRAVLDVPRLSRAWLGEALPEALAWDGGRLHAEIGSAPESRWRVVARASADRASWASEGHAIDVAAAELVVDGVAAPATRSFEGEAILRSRGRETLRASGRAARGERLALDVAWSVAPGALAAVGDARALGLPLPAGWRMASHGALSGRAAGDVPGTLAGDARLRDVVAISGPDAPVAGMRVRAADARARWSRDEAGGWRLDDARAKGALEHDRLGRLAVTAAGSASTTRSALEWKGTADVVSAGGLGRVRLTGRSTARGGGSLHADVGEASVVSWITLAVPEAVGGAGLVDTGGDLAGAIDARWGSDGRVTVSGSGQATQVAAQSADFTRAVTIPELPWTLEGGGVRGGDLVARLHAEAKGAQVLWGAAFADLSKLPPVLDARLVRARGGRWSADLQAQAGRVLGVTAEVAPAAGGGLEGRVAAAVPDVAGAWADLGTAGVLAAWPRVADFTPSGALSFEARAGWRDGGMDVDGVARIASGALADEQTKLALEGLDVELPVKLVRPARGEPVRLGPAAGAGRVRARRVALLGAEARGVDVPLRAGDDALVADADVTLAWLGGSVVLSRVALRDPLRPARALEAGVALQGLQLEKLGPVGPFTLTGLVSASFPRVSAGATSLDVEGGARVLAWGGEIVLDGIAGENPWSRFPRTRLSAHFSEIDLYELTTTFGFGAVHGLARGEVRELELFGLAPVRFDASIETEPREGVKQTISIPALQNLATLATGGRAPLFDKGLLRLVRTLRYEKIGMAATLQADAFVLRGLAERHGRELFMKGRLPLRVDVANAQPGAAVSFRAMLSRLAGLDTPSPDGDAAAEPAPEAGDDDEPPAGTPETELEIR